MRAVLATAFLCLLILLCPLALVPPEKITRKDGNPTGHVIIFIAPVSQAVLCYVMNGGV